MDGGSTYVVQVLMHKNNGSLVLMLMFNFCYDWYGGMIHTISGSSIEMTEDIPAGSPSFAHMKFGEFR